MEVTIFIGPSQDEPLHLNIPDQMQWESDGWLFTYYKSEDLNVRYLLLAGTSPRASFTIYFPLGEGALRSYFAKYYGVSQIKPPSYVWAPDGVLMSNFELSEANRKAISSLNS